MAVGSSITGRGENEYMNILPIIELTTAIGIFIGILMKNSVLKLRNCRVSNFLIFFHMYSRCQSWTPCGKQLIKQEIIAP